MPCSTTSTDHLSSAIEPLLQLAEALGIFLEQILDIVLVEIQSGRIGGLDFGQAETVGLVDAVTLDEFRGQHVSSVGSREIRCDRETQ